MKMRLGLSLLWDVPKTRKIKARIKGWINGRCMIQQVENVNDKMSVSGYSL